MNRHLVRRPALTILFNSRLPKPIILSSINRMCGAIVSLLHLIYGAAVAALLGTGAAKNCVYETLNYLRLVKWVTTREIPLLTPFTIWDDIRCIHSSVDPIRRLGRTADRQETVLSSSARLRMPRLLQKSLLNYLSQFWAGLVEKLPSHYTPKCVP